MLGPYSSYCKGITVSLPSIVLPSGYTYLSLGVAVRSELGCLAQKASTEPWAVALTLVRYHLYFKAAAASTAAADLAGVDAVIHKVLDISLQPSAKIFVERAATRQDNILVQTATNVNGRLLNDAINDHGQGSEEVGAVDFGVEEDLGGEESLVPNVDGGLAATHLVDSMLEELASVTVVLGEFLDNVGADIAVLFLDFLGSLE